MAISSRLIKRRIKSVANTRKITKAMELVAASKMRKSVQMTLASRTFSSSLNVMLSNVRSLVDPKSHPLFVGRLPVRSCLVIVTASDRGLCGGFNSQILKKTLEFLRSRDNQTIQVVSVGKRAETAIRRAGYPIVAAFDAISNAPNVDRARPVGEFASKEFLEGRTDRVFLVYMDFRSAVSQVPTVKQLLPMVPEAELLQRKEDEEQDASKEMIEPEFLFEPNPDTVLQALLPRVLDMQVYQALLESSASEHSARMLAMRNATDNATDMLQDLTLTFNQARQASITREISEISAGKAAIE